MPRPAPGHASATEMNNDPLILYVPGLKPKPVPEVHRAALSQCLVEGIRRIDPETAAEVRAGSDAFDVASWNFDFYGEYRDIELDRPGIAGILGQRQANASDRSQATTLKRRGVRWLYSLADRLPFLIPQVADETLELHLRDLRRYVKNEYDIAEVTRRQVKMPLKAAWTSGRPILLIGHSMGSVIAYDALWQLCRELHAELRVDLFMTLGSPLGERTVQRRLKGSRQAGAARYPDNIEHWVNIAAVGELTAIDMKLRNDFADMIEWKLVAEIEDFEMYNYFRQNGELNVHSEYGYLINEVTATLVRDWWRRVTR